MGLSKMDKVALVIITIGTVLVLAYLQAQAESLMKPEAQEATKGEDRLDNNCVEARRSAMQLSVYGGLRYNFLAQAGCLPPADQAAEIRRQQMDQQYQQHELDRMERRLDELERNQPCTNPLC
jgi:hypothetical protein